MSDAPKNITPAVDVLQGYFDDLLTPQGTTQKENFRSVYQDQNNSNILRLQPELQSNPAYKTQSQPSLGERAQRVAERLAKAKLAKLLTSAPTATETAEKKASPPKPVVERDVVVKAQSNRASTINKVAQNVQDKNDLLCGDSSQKTEAQSIIKDELVWLENGRPAWAQQRFDVLLFQVSGLTLAVPLICLGQIQPLTDQLTPLFGQADWFMGLQPTAVGKINTINTAKFVMPERYDDSFLQTAKYVISISGLSWGLAVCAVNQPISLDPEDVKWRSDRAKRPWLAGTVKEHRCALLDIATMGKILQGMDVNQRSAV